VVGWRFDVPQDPWVVALILASQHPVLGTEGILAICQDGLAPSVVESAATAFLLVALVKGKVEVVASLEIE